MSVVGLAQSPDMWAAAASGWAMAAAILWVHWAPVELLWTGRALRISGTFGVVPGYLTREMIRSCVYPAQCRLPLLSPRLGKIVPLGRRRGWVIRKVVPLDPPRQCRGVQLNLADGRLLFLELPEPGPFIAALKAAGVEVLDG
jgi:hypothetical protein